MNAADVLRQARDTYMRALEKPEGVKMLLIGHVVHIMAAAKGDTELANEALAYLPSHQERFDRGIARAEGRNGAGTTVVCKDHGVQLLAYRPAAVKLGCAVCMWVGPTGGDKKYDETEELDLAYHE